VTSPCGRRSPARSTGNRYAQAFGYTTRTRYNWRAQWQKEGQLVPATSTAPERWSPADKLAAVVSGDRNLKSQAHVGDGLVLVEELLRGAELADDLYSFGEAFGYGVVALAFHGASPGRVRPAVKLS
jgi:hypothetical protein